MFARWSMGASEGPHQSFVCPINTHGESSTTNLDKNRPGQFMGSDRALLNAGCDAPTRASWVADGPFRRRETDSDHDG